MQRLIQLSGEWHRVWYGSGYFRDTVCVPDDRMFRILIALIDRYRPAVFSLREWRFYLGMMLATTPVGAYFFMGTRYYSNGTVFTVGTFINLLIYWSTVGLFTRVSRWSIARFPGVQQAVPRMATMLVLVGGVMVVTAPLDLALFSVVPATGVQFSWAAVIPLWLMGCVLGPVFCLFVSMSYTYTQWHEGQTENEQLKREALQHQFDVLKSQLSPHFLFNSLNSLSLLISEDPQRAERFVDGLAKVYRYLLQAGNRDWTPLQAELDFITTYTDLLRTRYGDSLHIERQVPTHYESCMLPPLTIQTLVDNAIKHNVMLTSRPLTIRITTTETGYLQISNNVQRKTIRVATGYHGLAGLMAKYHLLGSQQPQVRQDDALFTVTLPLLHPDAN